MVINARGGSNAEVKGSWIDGLALAVARRCIDLEIVVLCLGDEDFEIQLNGVKYISVSGVVRGASKSGKILPSLGLEVAKKIQSVSPDIIHIHGTEHEYGCLNQTVYCGVPVVVSIQGVLSECYIAYTGGIPLYEILPAEFNLRNFLKLTSIFAEQRWWGKRRSWSEQYIFKRFKYFIGRTEFDRRCLEFYNPNAIYFQGEESINNAFRSVCWERAKVSPHTIYCGNAIGYGLKGGHWLIRAVAALKVDFPDIQLRIAASQDKLKAKRGFFEWLKASTYTVYIRRLIRKLGCTDCIVGLPALSPELVAEELSTAELFVLPSVCENSPNTLCEAMMVGTPSIATYVGGVPSIMKPDVEGRLVQACDPHALAGEIRRYFTDHAYAEKYVDNARKRAFDRHDDDKNAAVLFNTYKRILEMERK